MDSRITNTFHKRKTGREKMKCTTLKIGTECVFMIKEGCSFNGGRCHPIVEQCQGCSYVLSFATGQYCKSYSDPRIKWLNTRCNFATHYRVETKEEQRKKLNPLKASKRGSKKG